MKITAHTKIRFVGVCFISFTGKTDAKGVPGHVITGRQYFTVEAGEVVDSIWEMDGFHVEVPEVEFGGHPIFKTCKDGSFWYGSESMESGIKMPVEIPGVMTIEE